MNINCQNSAYVGRTHLNPADANYKILQGEIDVLTLNLDMASNMLKMISLHLILIIIIIQLQNLMNYGM